MNFSYVQSSFLGGEWGPYYQGRADNPKYTTAMNLALNCYSIEEGSVTRRPGTQFICTTRNGLPGRLIPFTFSQQAPYNLELTNGHMRLINGTQLVMTNDPATVDSISTDNPALVATGAQLGWVNGDQVQFLFDSAIVNNACAVLAKRTFKITMSGDNAFTIADAITGVAIDGSTLNWTPLINIQVARILDIVTPYTDAYWPDVRSVQSDFQNNNVATAKTVLLHNKVKPQVLTALTTPSSSQFASFKFEPALFYDGPYLDYIQGSTLELFNLDGSQPYVLQTVLLPGSTTPVGAGPGLSYILAGTITGGSGGILGNTGSLMRASPAIIGGGGYVRVKCSASKWQSTTVYGLNDVVSVAGHAVEYQSLVEANSAINPTTDDGTHWKTISAASVVGPNGFQATDVGRHIRMYSSPLYWDPVTTWPATIPVLYNGICYTALVTNTNVEPDKDPVKWGLTPNVPIWTWGIITAVNGTNDVTVFLKGPALIEPSNIYTWQLGAFSDTTGYPTCGCYYEGRLWLAGALPNRVDASTSNDIFNMAPTGPDGTVADNNGLTFLLGAEDQNPVVWMQPQGTSLAIGTSSAEWVMQAGTANDPITPTSVQVKRVTKYGSANILPVRTNLSTVFVQRYGRKMMELISDVFTGKFSAPNLSLAAKHLSTSGIKELAYQEELTPTVWARTGAGRLIGCTYRRVSSFATEDPTFVAWHKHTLGSGRLVESICVGPDNTGLLETLGMVTNDPATGIRHVETMTNMFSEERTLLDAWYLDDAVSPVGADIVTYGGKTYARLYGMWHLNGKTVTAWLGGLDCGDYLVTNGSLDVPFGAAGGLFTQAYLASLTGQTFGALAVRTQLTELKPRAPWSTSPATIQAYTGPLVNITGGIGSQGGNAIPDFANDRVFVIKAAAGTAAGVRSFQLSTGKPLLDRNMVQFAADQAFPGNELTAADGTGLPACVDQAGNFYFQAPNILVKLDGATLKVLNTFGGDTGSSTDFAAVFGVSAAPGFLIASDQLTAFNVGGGTYIAAASAAFQQVGIVNMGEKVGGSGTVPQQGFFVGLMTFVEPHLNIVGKNDPYNPNQTSSTYSAKGHAFGLGTWNSGARATTHFYNFTVQGDFSFFKETYAINASDVDPTWTNFSASGPSGLVYDQFDGTCIALFHTDEQHVNSTYLAKINPFNGKILLTVPIDASTQLNGGMQFSRMQRGFLALMPNTNTVNADSRDVWLIDMNINFSSPGGSFAITNAPSPVQRIQKVRVNWTNPQNYMASDDVKGLLFGKWGYTKTLSPDASPLPLNNTPTTFSGDTWATLTTGTALQGFWGTATPGSQDTTVTTFQMPGVVGFTFTTQAQILRPATAAQAGTQAGPAEGKTRRSHKLHALLANASGVSFTTDFINLQPGNFTQANGTPYTALQMYSGVYRDTLLDSYSYDSMVGWQVTRPYPCTVLQLGAFLSAQDI